MDDDSTDSNWSRSTEYLSESEYSDGFSTNEDESEGGLTWDSMSNDSRPPGPSPPSSSAMDGSPFAGRLSNILIRRVLPYVANSQTDEDSVSTSQMSSDSESGEQMNEDLAATVATRNFVLQDLPHGLRSLPDPPAHLHQFIAPDNEVEVIDQPLYRPPSYSPTSPSYSPYSPSYPNSPMYSPPGPSSPDYPPPNEIVPHSPPFPPSEDDDEVQIIEAPEEETAANQPVRQEPPQPPPATAEPPQPSPATAEPDLKHDKPKAPELLNTSTLTDVDENSLCSICMDPLTNSGKHRVVCLRCGHIFGQSCVERWIKIGCNSGAKRCPTCNKRACLKDIRILYLPKVVPLDTVERDRLIKEKEELMTQKNMMEMELSRCKLQVELNSKKYEDKLLKLENELGKANLRIEQLYQGKGAEMVNVELVKDEVRAELLCSVDCIKEGGCRVLAYNHFHHNLVVSQPSGNTVFGGYGVRVLNNVDYQPTRFVFLHSKMIRDLAYHPEDRDLLLSVSLDQSAKLVDMAGGTTVHTFKGEGPLWSCSWDVSNPHLMLVGSQQGKVCQYDRRMTDQCVNTWETKSNVTPVVALASIPGVAKTAFPQGGFLSCRLNGLFAFSRYGGTYRSEELQQEGPFMSMRYDHSSQCLLTMSRPSSRCCFVRLNLNLVDLDMSGKVCLPQIHTFNCGSSARIMSRMTTMPVLGDSLVIAHNESGRSVNMWSSKTGSLVHSFPVKEPIIDLCSMSTNSKNILASLSDKKVHLYRIA